MPDADLSAASAEKGGRAARAAALPALRAAIDRIIPADAWPAGWEGGVREYLTDDPIAADRDLLWAWPELLSLAARLDDEARRTGAADFAALGVDEQDAILAMIESGSGARAFDALRRVSWEGYYASSDGRHPAGLDMVGFRGAPEGVTPIEPEPLKTVTAAQVHSHYDAIIVGSGPGGGVAAQVLTAAGKHVLLVERAPYLRADEIRGDHLHGKRNAVYWPTVGPGPGHPRVAQTPDGDRLIDGTGDAGLYGLNADTIGGGTRIWQGMAWRFMPEDFRMASLYGNPDGASLADWPVSYDELEPYYTKAEWELGVAGEEGGLTSRTPRSAGYPMPAMGTEPSRELLGSAADRLGWGWGPIPLAINSQPWDGRAACVRCAQCIGNTCPVDAKNGSQSTFIPRAIATGLCDLLPDAEVVEVRDGVGAAGVTIMADATKRPVELTVSADVVVVSAGAVETARLLLASGLGNDHVGRYLHDHRTATVLGHAAEPVKPYIGPGHSVATLDHVHAATVPWGGGVIVDLMGLLPLTSAGQPGPGTPAWGARHKEWMRGGRANLFGVFAMGQEIPMPTSRVTLASVKDRWGRPGAALRKEVHWTSQQVEDGLAVQGATWLAAAGITDIRRQGGPATASAAGEHSCGTARMGTSSDNSATDPYGRVWGSHRVVACDSSLHPTNGSVNPTLTIVANAFRVAENLVAEWPR
ncbi:glucose-methanol-choline oxidoreductase [Planctomonas sp. JC2975]|uniref:GMC oxidoreductase n=1 Tax=Planctomonas sp. JC2975 TaxID=2729626 RepID=UPI001473727D|nr:GMC oxidoreductase [Planctomonas sp. JC2975]NNC13853.1 glucose-methanol-choline oxidoreductase [Planctomonas sp. JC2975]